ncbi:hypothetical protein OK016_15830 [Vibrio chagasii]|nr:hypothetical protein [Vibrio chagasii]
MSSLTWCVCVTPLIALQVQVQWSTLLKLITKPMWMGALAASVFHKQVINIGELKQYLKQQSVEVRL